MRLESDRPAIMKVDAQDANLEHARPGQLDVLVSDADEFSGGARTPARCFVSHFDPPGLLPGEDPTSVDGSQAKMTERTRPLSRQ
jgi:hypothetical protein